MVRTIEGARRVDEQVGKSMYGTRTHFYDKEDVTGTLGEGKNQKEKKGNEAKSNGRLHVVREERQRTGAEGESGVCMFVFGLVYDRGHG